MHDVLGDGGHVEDAEAHDARVVLVKDRQAERRRLCAGDGRLVAMQDARAAHARTVAHQACGDILPLRVHGCNRKLGGRAGVAEDCSEGGEMRRDGVGR